MTGREPSEVWVTCPGPCGMRILLNHIDVPVTVHGGQLYADMSEVSDALALHVRLCEG